MHLEACAFMIFCQKQFPLFFKDRKSVLDVGSGDINGNNRFLFDENCYYTGNDVFEAKNVTIVSKTKDLPFGENSFDTIVSTECFEHDPEYKLSFQKIVNMLKPGGLLVFTCASTDRAEHGTRRTSPLCSYGTIGNVEGWQDYYKNLTFEDFDNAINVAETFKFYGAYYNSFSKDFYFWGLKKCTIIKQPLISVKDYVAPYVSKMTEGRGLIRLSSAFYGTEKYKIDVTDLLNAYLYENNFTIDETVNINRIFEDPAVGEFKKLFLKVVADNYAANYEIDESDGVLRHKFILQ